MPEASDAGKPFPADNGQTDEGRAFVYLGSAAGLSAVADWTAESDQASAQFGFSVATAGDVNSDGFSDVIVAARLYDNGNALPLASSNGVLHSDLALPATRPLVERIRQRLERDGSAHGDAMFHAGRPELRLRSERG